jgi:SH3-like domain-containing protein
VVDTLPTDGPVEVSIVGAANGWLLLNEAWSASQQELEQPGWVYAPLLGVTTTSLDINNPDAPAPLYAEPDGSATVKAEVPKYTEVTLLNCKGDWLEVEAQGTTGWLAIGDQCSDPTNPCP